MPDSKQIETQLNLFRLFFALYSISFFLPACSLPKEDGAIYGFHAAFFATISILEDLYFSLGGLANFVILIMLLSLLFKYYKKLPPIPHPFFKIFHVLFILFGGISVSIWLFIWEGSLYIGYYLWAISVVGICVSHWNYQRLRGLQYKKEQEDKNDDNLHLHLVEE